MWMLEARPFHVLTDHRPLVFALQNASEERSARQLRHLSFIAEFTSDVRHMVGKSNVVADALSRPAAVVAPTPAGGGVAFFLLFLTCISNIYDT